MLGNVKSFISIYKCISSFLFCGVRVRKGVCHPDTYTSIELSRGNRGLMMLIQTKEDCWNVSFALFPISDFSRNFPFVSSYNFIIQSIKLAWSFIRISKAPWAVLGAICKIVENSQFFHKWMHSCSFSEWIERISY